MSTETKARRVLVTGGGSGLGRAIAERMAASGDEVVATVRDPARADRLTAEAAAKWPTLRYVPLELGDLDQVAKVASTVVGEGGLDVLVNNAGSVMYGAIEQIDAQSAASLFAVNVLGPIELTRRLLPALRERKGHVIFLGSMAGRLATPFAAHYSATKSALATFSDVLRMELKPFGVRVSCVEPGDFPTGNTESRRQYIAAQRTEQSGNSPYAPYAERCLTFVEKAERGGPSPDWVARAVERISRMKSPPVRQVVGRWGRTLCLVQRLIPESVREAAVLQNYGL